MSNHLLPRIFLSLHRSFRPTISPRAARHTAVSTNATAFPGNAKLSTHIMPQQRENNRGANPSGRKKSKVEKKAAKGTDEVLLRDVTQLLESNARSSPSADQAAEGQQSEDATSSPPELPAEWSEIEVKVSELSSTGDGLAHCPTLDRVYVVPFTLPGDTARVKVVRHFPEPRYTMTDFINVVEPSPQRDDSLVGCKYFSKCSGCQLQMLPYADQLEYKKRIVEKAYANFSGLIPELVPAVGDTMPSPLEYGYRTKLTPHFAFPGDKSRRKVDTVQTEVPAIGFTFKNRRQNIDIEDCPLGTDIVRRGLKSERERVVKDLHKYKRGATLLLRESTKRKKKVDDSSPEAAERRERRSRSPSANPMDQDVIRKEYPDYMEEKRCVTNPNKSSVEYVGDYVFYNKAGAFFQNNNAILEPFTAYIREHALPPTTNPDEPEVKYLLDAYSGSGLFTVTLSSIFKSSLGVDVDSTCITSARENARANNLKTTAFANADAATIFENVPYPPDRTVLVIDPSRKGCDDSFINQMLTFGPKRVVYVSCNVHTQARDVGKMVLGDKYWRYEIESIKGFDFFPQTGHVEGVAILNRAPATATKSS